MFPEKNQDSGGIIGSVCGGKRWKERVMSVTVLTSRKKGLSVTVPDHNHRDLQEIVLERTDTWKKILDS